MSSAQTHCYKSLRQTENTSHKLSTLWNWDGGICKIHTHSPYKQAKYKHIHARRHTTTHARSSTVKRRKKTHRVHRENDRSQRMSSCVNSRPTLRDVTHHLSEDGAATTTLAGYTEHPTTTTTTAYGNSSDANSNASTKWISKRSKYQIG